MTAALLDAPALLDLEPMFRAYLLTHGRRASTARTWVANVRLFMHYCSCRSVDPVKAGGGVVSGYLAGVLERKAHNTAALRLSCLRAFFDFCIDQGWRGDNPTKGLSISWEEPEPRPPFTDDELTRLVAACRSERDRVMIILGYDCGLRVSELVSLREENIDFQRGAIYFRGKRGKIGWAFPSQSVLDGLRDFCGRKDGILWWTKDDRPLTVKRAQRNMEEIARRAGVKAHWHRLRTTFANRAIESGVMLEDLQVLMRHVDMSTTRHYAGVAIRKRAMEAARGLNLGGGLLAL